MKMQGNKGLWTALVAALFAASCSENDTFVQQQVEPAPSGTHTVIINTGDAGITKTAISPDGLGFKVSWQVGDMIDLYEIIPKLDPGNIIKRYSSQPLAAEDINADGSASFKVELDTERQNVEGGYQYVAVYPYIPDDAPYQPYGTYTDWASEEDESYNYWKSVWGYTGEFVAPHATFMFQLPNEQRPSATSFDGGSDFMVSKMISTDEQLADVASMTFARMGSIICITCKGLDKYKGQQVTQAGFNFGSSYGGNLNCDYDPVVEKVKYYKGMGFNLFPQDVTVQDDGTVQLWIRGFAGTISDWCSVKLNIGGIVEDTGGKGGPVITGGVTVMRKVQLDEAGKSITMHEGGMTRFGVSNFSVADVPTFLEIFHCTNETRDGLTATWEHNAMVEKYECTLYSVNEDDYSQTLVADLGEATINGSEASITCASGLTVGGFYALKVKSYAKDGHCFTGSEEWDGSSVAEQIQYLRVAETKTSELSSGELEKSYDAQGKQMLEGYKEDTEYIYSSTYFGQKIGLYNVQCHSNGSVYVFEPSAGKTDWSIYSLVPNRSIKTIDIVYPTSTGTGRDLKLYVGNEPKACTVLVEPTAVPGSSTKMRYDITSLGANYKYFTIVDGGTSDNVAFMYMTVVCEL